MKKKTTLAILSLIAIFASACSKPAEHHDDHSHAEHDHATVDDNHSSQSHDEHENEKKAGPNGGRIVTAVDPHFEFFLTEERKIQITFLDDTGKAIAPEQQIVSLVGGDRTQPTILSFTKSNNTLISDKVLPDEMNQPVVLQIQSNPTATIIREKFNLNRGTCPTCEYKEYACVCGHDDGHHDH